jgi:hypothetical protein
MRISVITLATSDQQRASDFYRAMLEREPQQDRSGVTYFKLDGCWLALYPRADLARYCGVAPAGHGFEGITVSVNLASADAVHATAARAQRAGATLVRAPGPVDWGGHIAWIADPDGHLWELVYNPAVAIPGN